MIFGPEQSLVYSGVNTKPIEEQILKYYIQTDEARDYDSQLRLVTRDTDFKIYALVSGKEFNPKPFILPLRMEHNGDKFIVFDARPSTRYDQRQSMAVVNNVPLYRRDLYLAYFQALWQEVGASEILRLGNLQIKVFASWINETISKRFALDAEQSMNLLILSAYYYTSLFVDAGKLDKGRSALIISRALNLDARFVNSLLERVEIIADLDTFITVLPDVLVTERLNGLTIDVFISMLAGSWFGANNSILVGIALEYPPTFVTMLYLGLTDKSTKLSGISKLALRFERDRLAQEFITVINNNFRNDLDTELTYKW